MTIVGAQVEPMAKSVSVREQECESASLSPGDRIVRSSCGFFRALGLESHSDP